MKSNPYPTKHAYQEYSVESVREARERVYKEVCEWIDFYDKQKKKREIKDSDSPVKSSRKSQSYVDYGFTTQHEIRIKNRLATGSRNYYGLRDHLLKTLKDRFSEHYEKRKKLNEVFEQYGNELKHNNLEAFIAELIQINGLINTDNQALLTILYEEFTDLFQGLDYGWGRIGIKSINPAVDFLSIIDKSVNRYEQLAANLESVSAEALFKEEAFTQLVEEFNNSGQLWINFSTVHSYHTRRLYGTICFQSDEIYIKVNEYEKSACYCNTVYYKIQFDELGNVFCHKVRLVPKEYSAEVLITEAFNKTYDPNGVKIFEKNGKVKNPVKVFNDFAFDMVDSTMSSRLVKKYK